MTSIAPAPLFGGELEQDNPRPTRPTPPRQECMADLLDTRQPRAETQEQRERMADEANKAARAALRAAKAGKISVEEYAAIERQAGRRQWEAAVGCFELKGESE